MTAKADSKMTKNRIVLLDAHAIIHRGYHALPNFKARDGTPTGALFGLSSMIASIARELKPDYIIACYDLPGGTFRHDAFADYKGTRKKTDGELVQQLQSSRELMESLAIPIYDAPGYEADDVIGTLAVKWGNKENDIIIASGDMDTLQLVRDDTVRVFTLKKGITDTILINEDGVKERFGFGPEQIPDYKGLRGDASDNIPGIKGIGEKTGMVLIQKFGTIENLYKVLKKNPEKVKEAGVTDRILKLLEEGEESAVFSKMLATIITDVPVPAVLPDKKWPESFDRERAEKHFKKLEFKTMLDRFDGIYMKKEVEAKGEGAVQSEESLDLFSVPQNVDPIRMEEAKLMLWLLNSEKTNAKLEDILYFADTKDFDVAYNFLEEKLKGEKSLYWLYSNMDKPLIPIVEMMSKHGMLINKKYLGELSFKIRGELVLLDKEIIKLSGEKFNINSPKQLSTVLFSKLNLPTKGIKARKDGSLRADIETLEKLKDLHPIIPAIMEYRELEKLRSTYIDALPMLLDENDILHPQFIITGTSTGRFSSQNPNVQNIPVQGKRALEIRSAFVARPGYTFLACDYSQIDLRMAALLAQDEFLLQVFNDNRDIHTEVASRVYGVAPEDVTKEMRRNAKVINFGILYGMGSTALAKNMNVSRNEAKDFIDKYFSGFPKVAQYLDRIVHDAKIKGYTETLFGHRRTVSDLNSSIPFLRAGAERMATNAPIQGTSADVIRRSLVAVCADIEEKKLVDKAFPIMQIHDELVFEVADDVIAEVAKIIKEIMEHPIQKEFLGTRQAVPIRTEMYSGKNWGEMIQYKIHI